MLRLLGFHDDLCTVLILHLLAVVDAVDRWRRGVRRRGLRLRASIGQLRRAYLRWRGLAKPQPPARRRRAPNRIPPALEAEIVRLHVGWPSLGAGQLRHVVFRVLGASLARETIRNVLKRNQDLITALQHATRAAPRRIRVPRSRELWGIDLTLVWVCGFLPLWILGVVDYHGSRLVTLQPLRWPTAAAVVEVLQRAVADEGAPARVITDRGSVFRSERLGALLAQHRVKHTFTRPHHPWTNGRIERLFRTFKETVREHYWLVRSRREWTAVCEDFVVFYNRCRPHQSHGGRTPAEVHAGRASALPGATAVAFFDGRMRWWRFS